MRCVPRSTVWKTFPLTTAFTLRSTAKTPFGLRGHGKSANLSTVAPLWKPNRLKRSNVADSAITETLKTPVRAIMPHV